MPQAAMHLHLCGLIVPSGQRCRRCENRRRQFGEERRGSAQQRGYTKAWHRATRLWRAENPERNLCVDCRAEGVLAYGRQTDHMVPHRGDQELFWSSDNWQALCDRHHSQKTAREDGGFGNRFLIHETPSKLTPSDSMR